MAGRKGFRSLVTVAVVAALALGAIVYWQGRQQQPQWQTVTVEEGRFQVTVPATGTIEPKNRILVMAPVAGRVDRIAVREGQRVRKGQVLAWMSSTDRAALLDMASVQGEDAMEKWESEFRPTPILAPSAGVIIRRSIVAGQTVSPQHTLFELSDRLIVRAEVDETDIGKISRGQAAQVNVDAFPDEELRAQVTHIAHQSRTSNNVTVYEVELKSPDLQERYRSGMTVTINFVVHESPQAPLLPSWLAAGNTNSEIELMVRGEDGRKERRRVRIGGTDGKRVEVLSGISPGEAVLHLPQRVLADVKSPLGIFGRKK